MKAFFTDKFEYDFLSTKKWCEHVEEYEDDLNEFISKTISHIINVHHIWISRIQRTPIESHTWDRLPMSHWISLAQDNYRKTIDYLEQLEVLEKINYHDKEGVKLEKMTIDILYHILNHNNYHRGQIAREMRILGLTPPTFNFIAFK
ncbi:MAG: hypothetical protein MK066_13225 [Crocinitomicaceae bacterium]|nr:hypothetical protein [Crocinitomicaceae bacterium]